MTNFRSAVRQVRLAIRPGLFLKLMGAFLLVLIIMAALATWQARQATRDEFSAYTTQADQRQAQTLAPLLADYYQRNGSWDGVETALVPGESAVLMMGQGMGRGRGAGMGVGVGQMMRGADFWQMSGVRALVANAAGQVVADTSGEMVGQSLSEEALAAGVPIVTEQQVGTVLISSLDLPNSQSQRFLSQVNQAIVIAVVIAGAIALALGALLTWQITRPLRELTGAAEAIAAGELSRRVEASPSDEIGDLARAFNKMSAQLERAEQLRRQMTADIAHELRTPLAVIRGNVDALEDGVFPLTTEALAPIREKTALLERLVNDLHELTLMEAGQLSLNRQPTDVVALTHHTVDAFRATAERQSIKLETEFDANRPTAPVDPQRIEQVLVNLLSNALRHTPAGGTVTVRVAEEQDAALRISVTDTGPGIPAEALPNVFERFYRVDHEGRARPASGSGTGLGLAVARSIVSKHGGIIGAESPAGAGATIWFTVPFQPQTGN